MFFLVLLNDSASHIESAFVVTLQLGQGVYISLAEGQVVSCKVDIDGKARSQTGDDNEVSRQRHLNGVRYVDGGTTPDIDYHFISVAHVL